MKETILLLLQNVSEETRVLVLSLVPITGLKAAIPYGISTGLSVEKALCLAVVSEVVLVLLLQLSLPVLAYTCCSFSWSRRGLERVFARVQRHRTMVDKYGPWGLFLFVAIPFPGSGAWSGALLAFVLNLPFWKSVVPLTGGLVVAGIVVAAASLGVMVMLALEGGLLSLLLLLGISGGIWWLIRRRKG